MAIETRFLLLLFLALLLTPATCHATIASVPPSPSFYLRPANGTGPFKKQVVVFVHGIFGNSDDTWRFSPQVYWPEMLLSDATFSDSDIYVASYPTPFVGGRMNIEDIVSNLENRLKADYVFSKHREVVFVCHSLGGLIVENFLLKNRGYDGQVPFIYFFGTPQTGADIAQLGKLLSSDPLFKDLSASQDNEILQGIEDDWRAAQLKIQSYCAYETKPILGQVVVDRLSATRNCTEPPVAIDENHIGMVTPSGRRHDSYIALLNAIRSNPIAIKERPTRAGPLKAFPGFQEKEISDVTIMIATNILTVSMAELRGGEKYKFPSMPGLPALPVSIYVKNGVLCADVSMSGGAWDVKYGGFKPEDIKLNCYKFQVDNPNYDVNWSKNEFEVVRYGKVSIFQMIYRNSNTIEINGIFPIGHDQAVFLSPTQVPTTVSTQAPSFQSYGLNPLFKYPSWRFQGQCADGSR
ncbi:MAG: hypothetical protein WA867_21130 [Candidatus Acidiferrales bacterium]